MKNFKILILLAVLGVSVACSNTNQAQQQPIVDSVPKVDLPVGAIEMKYQRHLYCKVILCDSIPVRMIFDTGCTNLLLDSTFYAERFASDGKLRRAMLGGAGSGMEMTNIDARNWTYKVGEISQTESIATVLNLRKIVGDGVDGMFGMIFMQGKRVEFKYANGYMRILPTEEKINEDFVCVRCKWLDDNKMRVILPLTITLSDGYVFEGDFLVDTGMAGVLSFNTATAMRLKNQKHLSDARVMTYAVGGVGGSRKEYISRASEISIAGHLIKDVSVSWSDNKYGALAKTSYDGLVGNELFDRFDVIFDFAGCAIYLRPNKNFDKTQPNDFGIVLTPMADHWLVNSVLEGGNAAKAGLRHGDRVEKLNGLGADNPNAQNLYQLSDEITLTVLRGNQTIDIVISKEAI